MKKRSDSERKARFKKHWKIMDADGSGELDYEEFKMFLIKYNKKEMPEKQYEFFFRGTDVDGGGSIDEDEMFDLVEALYKNDQFYINKLFFRAVDTDKSGEIDAKEFIIMAELNGKKMTEEESTLQIKKLTGKETMTFPQMHKALTGQDIPEDTDPYDGKNKQKITEKGNANAEENKDTKKEKKKDNKEKDNKEKDKKEKKKDKQKENRSDDEKDLKDLKEKDKKDKKDKEKKEKKKDGKKKDKNNFSKSPAGRALMITMIVFSCLAAVSLVLSGAAYLYHYDKYVKPDYEDGKLYAEVYCPIFYYGRSIKVCETRYYAKIIDRVKPIEGFLVNSAYRNIVTPIILGILSLILCIFEIIVIVVLIMALVKVKMPKIIKNLFYGHATRGLIYIMFSIPTLGVAGPLGISSGIIMIVSGAGILTVGIVEVVLGGKKTKVSA
ncbi:hypothetical protein TRFO_39154 [Tritrichomonas foetus]|uniref:EF-hand domain-containing protein n=1 Tax=Tritrichomonas foetus TaxID=1144522 RepID=A0A1J4JBQ8_9EUKA|nr:hypothetical protein TRFO_39154 [Tritrichomonas foetus]|eukprot:OHS94684.1 hypothetical protein TRFO_39154 [Tritrichomonas foetus]